MAKELRSLSILIATGLGAGYSPFAPGTAGSLLALLLIIGLRQTPLSPHRLAALMTALVAVIFAVGVWSAGKAEKVFGRVDPGQVVVDEVVGQMITFIAMPRVGRVGLIAGFILFRGFDIVKPFPARRTERLPGGWGIMLDDVVAGFYSLIVLIILGHFIQ